MLLNEKYARKYPDYASDTAEHNKRNKEEIDNIKSQITMWIEDAQKQINTGFKSTKTNQDGINIPIKLQSKSDFVKTINDYINLKFYI